MISTITPRYWYLVLLFLVLAYMAYLQINGALALIAKLAGDIVSIPAWVIGHLANAFGFVNAVLILAACVWLLWFWLTTTAPGDFDFPSDHQRQHDTAPEEEDLEDIPDSEDDLEHDPFPDPLPANRPRKHKKSKKRTSSKGGTSSTTPPTTGTSTSSARTSNATWGNGDSLGRHGHGYGHWRAAVPDVDPPFTHSSRGSGKHWSTTDHKGGSLSSSTTGAPSTARNYDQPSRLAWRNPYPVILPMPVPARLDSVPVLPARKPSPPQPPSPPPTPAAPWVPEVETLPTLAPGKPGRIAQKGRSSVPYQRPSYRLARRSKKTSSPPTSGRRSAPSLVVSSTQDAFSPMIVEVEYDESLVLANRLELLSISSPPLPCTEKFQDAPSSPPLVEMASPIINHYRGESMSKQTALTEPRHYARYAGLSDCEPDSDSSDDDSMDIDASDSSDEDDSMDVDPTPVEFDDVDMNAWDHPPVESPLLGNSYAPSLRYQFFGLSLAATWEDPYHDHNMLVDSY